MSVSFLFGQEVPYLDKATNQPTYIRVKPGISFTAAFLTGILLI